MSNPHNWKYFCIEWLEWKLDIKLDDMEYLFCVIDGPRNMGKSTGMLNAADTIWWKRPNWKVVWARNNKDKVKQFLYSFNQHFEDKYYMTENSIYELPKNIATSDLKKNYSKLRHIGYCLGVQNAGSYKSMIANDVHVFIWDEFNEKQANTIGIWRNMIDLMKTIKRNNKPFYTFLLGNRVDGDSDILVNLEMERPDDVPYTDTFVQWIDKDVVYVSIGTQEFPNIEGNQEDDILNRIAAKNFDTDMYLNKGGFLSSRSPLVKLWKNIEPTHIPERYLTLKDYIFEEGMYDNDFTYIRQVTVMEQELPILALDNFSFMYQSESFSLVDESVYDDWFKYLKYQIKNKHLFFTTNDAKDILLPLIAMQTELIE